MPKYIIKYTMEDEIEAEDELDALILHQDNLSERLGSMIKEIVWEKKT